MGKPPQSRFEKALPGRKTNLLKTHCLFPERQAPLRSTGLTPEQACSSSARPQAELGAHHAPEGVLFRRQASRPHKVPASVSWLAERGLCNDLSVAEGVDANPHTRPLKALR